MELTKNDVHICRILFNKETHPMALAMYGDRAKEIYEFVCKKVLGDYDFFDHKIDLTFYKILTHKTLANFFLENDLVNFSCFDSMYIHYILVNSPIKEKIWDSGRFDSYLYKFSNAHANRLLDESPIADKIKASGKLKLK